VGVYVLIETIFDGRDIDIIKVGNFLCDWV